jgi:thiamine-monophosphate kinase
LNLPTSAQLEFVLAGGDDYELVFTAPPQHSAAVMQAARASQTPVTRIGMVRAAQGLQVVDAQGQALAHRFKSFDHFA